MKFEYKAKKGLEEERAGFLEAATQREALDALIAEGLHPFYLAPADKAESLPQGRRYAGDVFAAHVPSAEIVVCTQKLVTLMRARVELLAALRLLSQQAVHPALRAVLASLHDALQEGETFSGALERFRNVFSPLYISIVTAGEAAGRLPEALGALAAYLQREQSLRVRVRAALAYPIILLGMGVVTVVALMYIVVPKLAPVFISQAISLPLSTKIVLVCAGALTRFWFIPAACIAAVAVSMAVPRSRVWGTQAARACMYHIPVFARMARAQDLAHFSYALALLLKSGVSLLDGLHIAAGVMGDSLLRQGIAAVQSEVKLGRGLAQSMTACAGIPDFFTAMTAVGEESGRLTETMEEISSAYAAQVEADTTLAASVIEPVLIVCIGLVLGFIVVSILLPMFDITQAVR